MAASNNSLNQQNSFGCFKQLSKSAEFCVSGTLGARLDLPKMESSSADISGENATDVIYDYDQDYDYNGTFPAVDNPVAQSTFTYIVEGILLTVVSLIGKCTKNRGHSMIELVKAKSIWQLGEIVLVCHEVYSGDRL